jgi:hypothetical protein
VGLLDFLARRAAAYPTFTLRMRAEATDLLEEDGRVIGVIAAGAVAGAGCGARRGADRPRRAGSTHHGGPALESRCGSLSIAAAPVRLPRRERTVRARARGKRG